MKLFITGTDTNVGKTVVTGLLGRYLAAADYQVVTQKWVQTGKPPYDIESHRQLMKKDSAFIKEMAPYVFPLPASPHLAAKAAGQKISVSKIRQSFARLAKAFEIVLVEGTGGALVPYNNSKLLLDIARQLHLPVLIVVQNKLGAVNHTLLTIEALRQRKMKIIGLVFNQTANENELVLQDNPQIIKKLSGEKILGNLPRLSEEELLYKAFLPIGEKILRALKND